MFIKANIPVAVKSGTKGDGTEAQTFLGADRKVEKSVRLAADPVTNMFSAGMLSIREWHLPYGRYETGVSYHEHR